MLPARTGHATCDVAERPPDWTGDAATGIMGEVVVRSFDRLIVL